MIFYMFVHYNLRYINSMILLFIAYIVRFEEPQLKKKTIQET